MENKKQIYLPWYIWITLILIILGSIAYGLRKDIKIALDNNESTKKEIVSQKDSITSRRDHSYLEEKEKIEWDAYVSRELTKKTNNEKIIINTDSSTDYKYRVITKYKPSISADFGTDQ